MGCALGAMMAGFAAVDRRSAARRGAATATLTVCGDLAAARAPLPGSFAVALLDELAAIAPADLAERVRLS